MQLIGTVVRLQVQRSHLKPRPSGSGRYDPAPLLPVDALDVTERGCVGVTPAGPVVDLHHADHPESRNVRLVNGLSLLPLSNYQRLRARYGEHVVDGSAGENVLVDGELGGDMLLELDGEPVPVTGVMAAPPCMEFSRWCLQRDDFEVDDEVRAALENLDHGARGTYARVAAPGRLVLGARVWRA
ncbi:MAG: hypothetical protein ABIO67_02670 [Mycobacteriales bacterium]